jgi:hypothetical protein
MSLGPKTRRLLGILRSCSVCAHRIDAGYCNAFGAKVGHCTLYGGTCLWAKKTLCPEGRSFKPKQPLST